MRVGVARRAVDLLGVGDLHDAAEVHDGDAVGDVAHHGQVVRDEDVRQPELVLQVLQQVDHLRLDGHVERGHRLVADDQLGPQGDGPGDADALSLSPGELVGVAVEVLGVEADAGHQVLDLGLDATRRLDALHLERRGDDATDGVPRVERRVRVLEDHLHLATQGDHRATVQVGDVPALELDLPAGRVQQLHDRAAGGRLAAAGLADDAQCLAGHDVEGDLLDRPDVADLALEDAPAGDREVLLHPVDAKQGVLAAQHLVGAAALLVHDRHLSSIPVVLPASWAPSTCAPRRSLAISRRCAGSRWQRTAWSGLTGSRSGRSVSHRLPGTSSW